MIIEDPTFQRKSKFCQLAKSVKDEDYNFVSNWETQGIRLLPKEQTSGSQASSHIRSRKKHDVAEGQTPLDNAPSQSTGMPGSIDKDLSSKNASFLAVAGMTLERQTQV